MLKMILNIITWSILHVVFAEAMITNHIVFNTTNLLDGSDDVLNRCDNACNYSTPHAVVGNGGNRMYSYEVICKSNDDFNPVDGCDEYYSCLKLCLGQAGETRSLGLMTDFAAYRLAESNDTIFQQLGSDISLYAQRIETLDWESDEEEPLSSVDTSYPSPAIHAWPTPLKGVGQNGPPNNRGYATNIFLQFFLYVYKKRISQANEYSNDYEGWSNLECGVCYTVNGKIKRALTSYLDLNKESEVRFMYWPHHDCRLYTTRNKDFGPGQTVAVDQWTQEVLHKADIGSFWIQCDEKQGWPGPDTGYRVRWPTTVLTGRLDDPLRPATDELK